MSVEVTERAVFEETERESLLERWRFMTVLTLDSHADTPLRMIEPGFDMAERHDPNETGSKVDYPRMVEGGLDAIFLQRLSPKIFATTKVTAERRH